MLWNFPAPSCQLLSQCSLLKSRYPISRPATSIGTIWAEQISRGIILKPGKNRKNKIWPRKSLGFKCILFVLLSKHYVACLFIRPFKRLCYRSICFAQTRNYQVTFKKDLFRKQSPTSVNKAFLVGIRTEINKTKNARQKRGKNNITRRHAA